MWVELGNDNAVEGYRDRDSDDPELVRFRPVEGDRVTSYSFPEGTSLQEAFTTVVNSLGVHFVEVEVDDGAGGTRKAPAPARWVDSDSEGLKALLTEHFGLKSGHARPRAWGKDTGADKSPFLVSTINRENG